MIRRTAVAIVVSIAVTATAIHAQAPAASKTTATRSTSAIPRTPEGKPDFQGSWSTATYTPLERPAEWKDKELLTREEADAYVARMLERAQAQAPDDIHYDNFLWMSDAIPRDMTSLRTSMITEPADGRMPPVNAEGRARAEARRTAPRVGGPFDSAQSRSISERCIYWGHEGPPVLPTGYNNMLYLVQSPSEFVIIPEMMPVPRIAPLDGRPFVNASLQNLRGSSRARWDGDTMVVETRNFTERTPFRGSSEHLKVTERFTMIDADSIRYEFVIDDPHTWDTTWKGEYIITRSDSPRYEYACHEGNYGIRNSLSAQRKAEAEAEAAKTTGDK